MSSYRSSAQHENTAPFCLKRKIPNASWRLAKIQRVQECWRTATYMTIISGHDLVHVLEALVVGMALKKTSTRRRICFVNDVPRQMELLLHTVWEIRNFTDLGLHGFSGASKRLSKIHSKLLALWWIADVS